MTKATFHLPHELRLNAWTGSDAPSAKFGAGQLRWASAAAQEPPFKPAHRAPELIDDSDWRSPKVGWGLVLPDNPQLPASVLATAADAPEPIRRLVAERGNAPVLRWRATGSRIGSLVRYDAVNGREWPMSMRRPAGTGVGELPLYLLIFAPPSSIPWSFQYAANPGRIVGRLWLEGEALENYVGALIADWQGTRCDVHAPLAWSVDHGKPDITWLMDRAISRKVVNAWAGDRSDDFGRLSHLQGDQATNGNLIETLARTQPALVLTTSHGMTGPLTDAARMTAQLGLPVDAAHRPLDLEALCEAWQPDGAIWYSHACCSAGSDTASAYEGLFDPASEVARILGGVAAGCGARIAPLPQRLLGAKRPLRAFIGHVEPTFDWTLLDPVSQEPLTHSLVDALYQNLFAGGRRWPIGLSLAPLFAKVGPLYAEWREADFAGQHGVPGQAAMALHRQIQALDLQHTVILGDPTVALPALHGSGKAKR